MASRLTTVAEEEDAGILKFPKEFEQAETLTIGEVLKILENREEQSNRTESGQRPNEVFVRTLEHCRLFNKLGGNREKIQAVRRMLQTKALHKFELAQLANLCPEFAEEAKAYIPSLERNFNDEELKEIINAMNHS